MLLHPIQHQAPIVTHTETATGHAAFSPGGMFDGSLGLTTSTVGNTQAVTVNSKYLGWKLVGLRYLRQNHNNTVKNQGIRQIRLDYMDEATGNWVAHATFQFPYGEYSSLVNLLGSPVQPIIINSRRQFRVVAQSAWNGSSLQWLEIQLVVGYA